MRWRWVVGKRLGRVLILLGCAAGVGAVFVTQGGLDLLTFSRADHSPFDYGPLRGKAVALPPSAPSSSVDTGRFTVDCYSYPGQPVIIASRDSHGSNMGAWELEPMKMHGDVVDQVGSCEIGRSAKKKDGYVIHGTNGYEHVTLYFDKAGRFVEYFFSW